MSGALRRRVFAWAAVAGPPLLVLLVGLIGAQQAIVRLGIKRYLLPTPLEVWSAIRAPRTALWAATCMTAEEAAIGFAASAVLGTAIAVMLSSARWMERAFYPYAVFFQTVPVVAVAPLLVIWFDAGVRAVAACAFIVSIFPVIANTLAGLRATDPALLDLFRLYGGGRAATMWKLRLPGAVPAIVTGLRISSGLAVIGAVVGEFVAGVLSDEAGLGVKVLEAKKYGRTDVVFAAIVAASLLGLVLFGLVNLAGWLVLRRWHASAKQ